jgi:polyisoprenoid-binding protein YceI
MLAAFVLGAVLTIDAPKSNATFTVSHVFVGHVTGTVPIVSGTIDIPPGARVPARVSAVLDPKKIKTDEPDRDAALQGPDWFDTALFPQWTFVSTAITPTATGFTMDGLLTIHGVSQPEELTVTVGGEAAHPSYHATGFIDRHAFGMKRIQLDPAIGNPVSVTLDIVTQ